MEITKTLGEISFTADENGAELHSLKFRSEEYLWQCGDAWKRYAPILFPFICSPDKRKYFAGGKEYTLPGNHGFARDSVFTLEGETETSVTYRLESSQTTKQWYPYDFCLYVSYEIKDGRVVVTNKVENTGVGDMYFYLGGHPAFICDIESGESVVEYEKDETITQPTPDGERTVLDNERTLRLDRPQFKFDVIMKDKPQSKSVTLKKADGGYVTLYFPDSQCIAVWTALDPAAQFICLEPWTSVPAYADDEYPDIENKPHAVKLGAGSEYVYTYSIEVGKLS
ncbi:MAG: aldose 1-epimerase family protein [Oscillospiraceae bacterium]